MDINFKYSGKGFRYFQQSKEYKKTLRDIERRSLVSKLYPIPYNIYSVDVIKPRGGVFEWIEIARFEGGGCAYVDQDGKESGLARRVSAWECCKQTYRDWLSHNEIFNSVVICNVCSDGKKEILHVLSSSSQADRKCYGKKLI